MLKCGVPAHNCTHAHTAHTRVSKCPHTRQQCPHTHSSGPQTYRGDRGCQNGESLKRVWSEKAEMWVFRFLARLWLGGKRSRDYLPLLRVLIATLSARHGARPGPKLAPSVQAAPLRASQPRAREETRDQNRICGRCAKKMQLRIGGVTLGGVLDYSSSRRGHRCRCFPHPVRALMLVAQRARRSHNC